MVAFQVGSESARGRHLFRLVAILWLLLGLIVSVRALCWPKAHTVFPIFAASAQHWWADQPLYAHYPPLDQYRYPPAFAVAVTPFALLGLRAGGVAWFCLSLGVYGLGLWRFACDVSPRWWTRSQLAAFLGFSLLSALCGLWNSQSNALAVGLLLLATAALVSENWWWSASLLAVAVSLKVTPLAPALLLCGLWPRRLAPRFLAVLAMGALMPFLTRPPDIVLGQYVEWVDHLSRTAGGRWPGFRDGWTAWTVIRAVLTGDDTPMPWRAPIDSPGYRAVQLLSALAALAWCWRQRQRGAADRWLAHVALGIGLCWLVLCGPAVEHQTFVFLAPPLAWAIVEARAWPRGRILLFASFTLIVVLGWDALTLSAKPWFPLAMAALPTGTVLFSLWWVGYGQTCPRWLRETPHLPEPELLPHVPTAPRPSRLPSHVGKEAIQAVWEAVHR